MLGSAGSKELLKTSHSVTARGKATAEWNHNIFNSARVYGTFSTTPLDQMCEQIVTGDKNTNSSLRGAKVFKSTDSTPKYYSNSYNFVGLPSTFSYSNNNNKGFKIAATQGQCFRVSFYAKTTSPSADKIFLHFTEFNGTTKIDSGGMSRAFTVDNVDWTFSEVLVSIRSPLATFMQVDFSSEIAGDYQVSDISVVKISLNETTNEAYLKVKDTFGGFRPGDELAEQKTVQKLSKVIYRAGNNIFPFDGSRSYVPGPDMLSYYMEQSSGGVYAMYDQSLSTNKIVIKMLNGSTTSTLYGNYIGTDYKLYTFNATTNVWTEYLGSSIGNLEDNGSLTLYWSGSTWTKTETVSQVASDGKSLTGVTSIDGIALRVNSVQSNTTPAELSVRFLEVSPRLVVDLTDYIVSFEASKELDSNDIPLPVGFATANNASLSLENLPRIYTESNYFNIFSDLSSKTPFSNILKRDVKIRIKYDLINGSGTPTDINLPFFTGYVDSWATNDTSAEINLFDYAKYLQNKKTKDVLMLPVAESDNTLFKILSEILEQNGVSDYQLASSMNNIGIGSFYADKQKSVWEIIQDLLLPYQYMAYINNNGTLIVNSYSDLSSGSPVFALTDVPITGYLSNINDFSVEKRDKPSEIKIRYTTISTRINPNIGKNDIATNTANDTVAPDTVWTIPDKYALGYCKLKNTIYTTDKEIQLDSSTWGNGIQVWNDYSGYLSVNNEIMKYDGIEISYRIDSGPYRTAIVKSEQEYQKIKSDILEAQRVSQDSTLSIVRTGKLVNVERGMFGTQVETHYALGGVSIPSSVPSTPPVPASQSVGTGLKIYSKTSKSSNIATHDPSPSILKVDHHGGNRDVVTRLESISGKYITMMGYGGDSNSFDTYEFVYAYPADKTSATYSTKNKILSGNNPNNENDFAGVFMGVDPATEQGIFIEFPLKGNNDKKVTAVFFNKKTTPTAKSTYKMNLLKQSSKKSKSTITIPAVKKKVKKKMKVVKKAKKVTTTTVLKTQEFNEQFQTIVVKVKNNKITSVTVNGAKVKFTLSNKKSWNGSISSVTRNSKAFGVFAGKSTHINVLSVRAYNSATNAAAGGSTVDIQNAQAGIDSPPVGFTTGTVVRGVQLFDVETTGPSYSHVIFKPSGAYEVGTVTNEGTNKITINDSIYDISQPVFTPYRTKFMIKSQASHYAPLSDTKDTTPLTISAKILTESKEAVFSRKITDNKNSSNVIEISSKWIQTEENAKKLMQSIDKYVRLSFDTYNVEIFGNPLLEIGDIVNLYYYQSDLTSSSKYIIIGVEDSFDGGFTTSLTLRKIAS